VGIEIEPEKTSPKIIIKFFLKIPDGKFEAVYPVYNKKLVDVVYEKFHIPRSRVTRNFIIIGGNGR